MTLSGIGRCWAQKKQGQSMKRSYKILELQQNFNSLSVHYYKRNNRLK